MCFALLRRRFVSRVDLELGDSHWPQPLDIGSAVLGWVPPFSGEGGFHTGVDISAVMGTPVHAAADGIVYSAEVFSGYGKAIVIDHGNGMRTLYAHLSRYAVVPGQEIRKADIVGYSGATGRVTSPHLHFEVRVGGAPVNPYPYLSRSNVIAQVHPDLPF